MLRVLVYKEDDQFVAHALEMDILGYGKTEASAKKELESLLDNQLSFAACKGVPETTYFPAPKEFFNRWEKAHKAALKGDLLTEKSLALYGKPTVIVYSEEDVRKLLSTRTRDFAQSEKLAA